MDSGIDWFQLVIGLLGGLALFLFGMEQMGDALKAVAGERMRAILARLSDNRLVGMLTGAGVTAVIQSSSVTTVMLVGFVSADLMSLSQSIGVILGANIGTTVTAQIVAFKVTKYALLLVAIGFGALFMGRIERVRQYGAMIMGLGLIFFGMAVMSSAMKPLRGYEPFLELMATMSNPFTGILWAALFTALIQSSSATMGVVIVLASDGLIDFEAGLALVLGSNVGTCVTAALAAIGKPREAVRVAGAHVLFNIVGVMIVVPFLGPFAELILELTPAPDAAAGVPRQVANAHTAFNIAMGLLFLPFAPAIAVLVTKLVPDRPAAKEQAIVDARYLDPLLLETPSLALGAARREMGRIARQVALMLDDCLDATLHGDAAALDKLEARDERVDALYAKVVAYLGAISQRSLSKRQTKELMGVMAAANDLESVGDLIETDLVALGRARLASGLEVSEMTEEKLRDLHNKVVQAFGYSALAIVRNHPELAKSVISWKQEINQLVSDAEKHQAKRLVADEPNRLEAYAFEIDVIDKLKRIYYHAKRIAKAVEGKR